jgi:CheY-like chemotaxis protein
MELEASSPPSSSDGGDGTSASSTLFFEKTDVILVIDDVSLFSLSLLLNILIVSQNVDMRSFIRSIFAPYVVVILEASSGIEALEIAATRDVNLILRYDLYLLTANALNQII